ncbi:hypothetical protein [Mycolicibacter hiberniae]|uniref:Uncharacterized protein n=1 Tax=Mycolicibacter hiberniae TaxID=29314 RepID=A0A7I7X2Z8_9MYCO|nr:hypothetical protein [Mycolicibacter hiberniae]MCV7086126.1 hypothetical protein [Mycolicibacter hiberniae]BBZ24239.1 hypothetical protein MHIB_26570 [Mycolicibacter hiberniae]
MRNRYAGEPFATGDSEVAVRISVCAETDSTAAAQALLDAITAKIDAAAGH